MSYPRPCSRRRREALLFSRAVNSQILDHPWSQVRPVIPPDTCLRRLRRTVFLLTLQQLATYHTV